MISRPYHPQCLGMTFGSIANVLHFMGIYSAMSHILQICTKASQAKCKVPKNHKQSMLFSISFSFINYHLKKAVAPYLILTNNSHLKYFTSRLWWGAFTSKKAYRNTVCIHIEKWRCCSCRQENYHPYVRMISKMNILYSK